MKEQGRVPGAPIGPGEVLRKRILAASNITQQQLANAMRVSRLTINQIINGRRSITAEMAIRLAHVTSTTPKFWLDLQREMDLDLARTELERTGELNELKVLRKPKTESELFRDHDHPEQATQWPVKRA